MPQSQAARRAHYQFGAALAGATDDDATVLQFRRKFTQGGDLRFLFETPDANRDIEVTVQMSVDGIVWTDTTVAAHGLAVVDEVLKPRTQKDFTVHMRPKLDEFMRIVARGADRGGVSITGNELIEIENVIQPKGGGAGE